MIYTIQAPYSDNWSKNPILFTLRTSSVLNIYKQLGFAIQVQDYITDDWDTIYNGNQQFNANGESQLDIARICDTQLEYHIAQPWDKTAYTTDYVVFKKQARKFRVVFWETDDVGPTTIISNSFYVLKGGLNKEQYNPADAYRYFFSYNDTNEPVKALTYNSIIYKDQGIFFISFYIPFGVSATHLRMYVIDSSPNTVSFNITDALQQGDVISFFIDVSTITSDTTGLRFTLHDGSMGVSTPVTFKVVTSRYVHSKIFAYTNSLGGTDVIYMPYNQLKQSEQARDTFNRVTQLSPVPYIMQVDAESFQTNQIEEVTTGIDTGELSAEATDAMRELCLAPNRFEMEWSDAINSKLKYIPVNVISKKNITLNLRNLTPQPMYFEVTRAVKNLQYTPGNTECDGRLTANKWTGIAPQIEDYFYMLLEDPAANPMVFALNINKKMYADYGDNITGLVTGSLSHTYANNNYRKVTIGTLLQYSQVNFYITGNGKITKLWGKLPRLIPNLKLNNQSLIELPRLPDTLVNIEVEYNQLTKVPKLPASIASIKMKGNEIDDFTVTNIPVNVSYLDLSLNQLPVSVVDYIINKLDTNGVNSGTLKLEGQTPPAAPSVAVTTQIFSLLTKGWTVITD